MKHSQLKEIIKKKTSKKEFAIVTNLENGLSEIYEPGKSLSKEFEVYKEQIYNFFKLKKNGVIENTEIFIETVEDDQALANYEPGKPLNKEFETHKEQIDNFFKLKKKWSNRKNTNIC